MENKIVSLVTTVGGLAVITEDGQMALAERIKDAWDHGEMFIRLLIRSQDEGTEALIYVVVSSILAIGPEVTPKPMPLLAPGAGVSEFPGGEMVSYGGTA